MNKKDYGFLIKEAVNEMELLAKRAEDEGRNLVDHEQSRYNDLKNSIERYKAAAERQSDMENIKKDFPSKDDKSDPVPNVRVKTVHNRASMFQEIARAKMGNRAVNAAAAGISEVTGADGGFLVPQAEAEVFIDLMYKNSILLPYCSKKVLTTSNTYKLAKIKESSRADGSRAGGALAYWLGSGDEVTASKPQFELVDIKLGKLMSLCYADSEIIEDAGNLISAMDEIFEGEFAFKIDDAIIRGSGKAQPLGILNSNGLVSVAKETGQSADTIVFENVKKMWSALQARAKKNAIWMINSECLNELQSMTMTVGTGGVPVYMPAYGVSGSPYNTLYGRPVVEVESCSALGDKGDIILADLTDYRWIDKKGTTKDSSIAVNYIYDQEAFRFRYRCNGVPRTQNTLTPYKGSQTQGKYVTLAARA